MKLQILSDLHLDFHRDKGVEFLNSIPVLSNTAVIAGDLSDGNLLKDSIKRVSDKWERVIFVMGNHDCYHSSIAKTKDVIRATAPDNFIFLDNEVKEIDGQRFVGGAMWFRHQKHYEKYAMLMNDFRLIDNFVNEVFTENLAFSNLIIKPDDVVVTHHLPHEKSVAERFEALNMFFLNVVGLEYLSPQLWIHGHTHGPFDYEVSGTRVVCNPAGYPSEFMTNFNNSLVVKTKPVDIIEDYS